MSVTYKVKVGREHIDRGIPCDGESCAVALAVVDAVPGATDVLVDGYRIELVAGGERLAADLPDVAVEFINDFDDFDYTDPSRRRFEPIEFEAVFDSTWHGLTV